MQEAQKDPVALAQIIRSWLSEESDLRGNA
jgi:hypothetical protein